MTRSIIPVTSTVLVHEEGPAPSTQSHTICDTPKTIVLETDMVHASSVNIQQTHISFLFRVCQDFQSEIPCWCMRIASRVLIITLMVFTNKTKRFNRRTTHVQSTGVETQRPNSTAGDISTV